MSRKGTSWLQVKIAGSGSLASTLMAGAGPASVVGDFGPPCPNKLLIFSLELATSPPPAVPPPNAVKACFCLAYTSDPELADLGGSIGKKLNGTYARGFSLNIECLATVTLTKYLISASPGNPLKVGGKVRLTCRVAGMATSMPTMTGT
jgi:hypothetical protein